MLKLASEVEILNFFRSAYGSHKERYYGFYNSHFNQIITDEKYMLIPVDERIATRAHGVFDVIYLKNYRLLNLDQHLARIFKSAESASIKPPLDFQKTKDIVVEVVEKVVNYHLENDADGSNKKVFNDSLAIRLTISSGYGDFGVASLVSISLFRENSLSFM